MQAQELNFRDLPPIPGNTNQQDLLTQINSCFSSPNFSERIQGLNILRAINKQFPSDSKYLLKMFLPCLAKILNGPKTVEHKTVFIYFQEILANEPGLGVEPEIISELVPLVVQKSIAGKGFIKTLAQRVLDEMTVKCNFEGLLYALLLNTGNKNVLAAQLSIKHFVKVLRRKPEQNIASPEVLVQNLSKDLFFMLFKGLVINLRAKRIQMVNPSEAALLFFLDVLGQEKFVYIIELMVSEGQLPADLKQAISCGIENAQKRKKQRQEKAAKKQKSQKFSLKKSLSQGNVMNSILSQTSNVNPSV